MKVKLISMTNSPVETLLSIWYMTKIGSRDVSKLSKLNDIITTDDISNIIHDKNHPLYEDAINKLELIMKTPSMALKRQISVTWILQDIPVALREQLVRHQNGNHFWVRSSRVDNLSNSEFYMPIGLDKEKSALLKDTYNVILESYKNLIEVGVNPEDAKMIMPESRLHTMSWTSNLDAMTHVLKTRANWFAQEFWIPVMRDIVSELRSHYESLGYNEDIVRILLLNIGDPSYSAKMVDDYPIKLDMIEKMEGDYPQPVDPIFLLKYSKDNKVSGYPQTCEPYKVEQYFKMFRGIWSEEYKKLLEVFTEDILSTPMPEEEIEYIKSNVLNSNK